MFTLLGCGVGFRILLGRPVGRTETSTRVSAWSAECTGGGQFLRPLAAGRDEFVAVGMLCQPLRSRASRRSCGAFGECCACGGALRAKLVAHSGITGNLHQVAGQRRLPGGLLLLVARAGAEYPLDATFDLSASCECRTLRSAGSGLIGQRCESFHVRGRDKRMQRVFPP